MLRPRPLALAFALVACSSDGTPSGTEGGPCRVENPDAESEAGPCDEGLVCASDLCVSLGEDTDEGESAASQGESGAGEGSGNATTGNDDADTSDDAATDDSATDDSETGDPTGDSDSETGDETSGDSETGETGETSDTASSDTAGDGSDCPFTTSQISCASVCAARQAYCDNCDDGVGPCSYFDVYEDMADCIAVCQYVYDNGIQNSIGLEADACFQLTAGSCDFPECFIDASCDV